MIKKKIGLVVPSSNITMETDFIPRMPNKQATLHVARMHIEHTTREEEEKMVNVYFPQCLDDLKSAGVDIILFGCTSAGTLQGKGTEQGLETMIMERTGIPGLTVTHCITGLLREMGAKRIVLFTPYLDDLTASVQGWLLGEGFDVVLSAGMRIIDNKDIAAVTPEEIADFSMEVLQKNHMLIRKGDGSYDLKDADAILYSCTNFNSWDSLDIMKKRVRTNYTTSNHALFTYTLRKMGLTIES